MTGRRVRIGPWVADEASDSLVSAERRVKLERRAMATLMLLAGQPGKVVSRDAILAKVWPGLHVSDHSVAIVISDLRRALGDDRLQPRFIETITKRGYRLIAAVGEERKDARPGLSRRPAIAALALGLVGAATASLWAFSGDDRPPPIFVADIVAPRGANESGIEFALGDMIGATLARAGTAPVVRLRPGQPVPNGPGRLVRGRSLAQGADRLVLIQIEDIASGEQIWARTYLVAPSRLAPRSIEVALDVASALRLVAPVATAARVGPDAYERYWRARSLWDRREAQTIRAARQMLEALIADEPGFAAAHAALAEIYAHKSGEELGIPRVDTFAAARRHLAAARALGPATSETFVTEAVIAFYADRDFAAARRAAQHAVELAPGRPAPWQTLAMVESAAGDSPGSIFAIDHARALDPGSGSIVWDQAWHLLIAGNHREALAAAEEARRMGQSVSLLTALARAGLGHENAAFSAWLERATGAGIGPAELAAIRFLPDRRAAYHRLAEAFERDARPARPVVVALLMMKAGRPAEARRELSLAERGRGDWMAAWAPRMREFAALRTS